MQNPPPDPERKPPIYQPPYSQPIPPNAPPQPPYTQPLPPYPPPYPPYSQPLPPYPPPPYPLIPYPQAQDNTTALVLEAVCSVFGIYGIGWLFRGRVLTGIVLLVGGFVWIAFAIVLTLFTFGFGLLCIGPLHILFIVGDVLLRNSELRQP